MAPADLTSHRARRRLSTSVRQAAMHATPGELVDLRAVIAATHDGTLTVEQARTAVASLRRHQQERVKWPPTASTCSDRLDCACPTCLAETARLQARGPRRIRQPWQPARAA